MNDNQLKNMSILLSVLSDFTRLKILSLLFDGERNVSSIADDLNMTHSAISHQLSTLKKTKIVTSRRSGKNIFYSLADMHIKNIFEMAFEHANE